MLKILRVLFNLKTDGITSLPAKIKEVDKNFDLASLRVYRSSDMPDSIIEALGVDINLWKEPNEIKEGETVIYMGYPSGRGLSYQRNYTLSRIGIVSQLVTGKEDFLIDAFVQPGYSGSPVFLISKGERYWTSCFVGIIQSYPYTFGKVCRDVTLFTIDTLKYIENPGFAKVIGTGLIKKFFELK